MSAKLGFAAGLAVGVLAGSRAGRGIYDRSAAAASAVVHDPRVRSGASSALHRAGSAGSTVAGAAVRKVTGKGKADAEGKAEEGTTAEGEGGRDGGDGGNGEHGRMGETGMAGSGEGTGVGESRTEQRVRMKRLMGGVRGHRRVAGDGVRGHVFSRHAQTQNGSHHSRSEVSAPSVQAKPTRGGDVEGVKDEGGEG